MVGLPDPPTRTTGLNPTWTEPLGLAGSRIAVGSTWFTWLTPAAPTALHVVARSPPSRATFTTPAASNLREWVVRGPGGR